MHTEYSFVSPEEWTYPAFNTSPIVSAFILRPIGTVTADNVNAFDVKGWLIDQQEREERAAYVMVPALDPIHYQPREVTPNTFRFFR